ncbi:MAG TPA: phosphotransferase family protein [Gammaproteobacteria bacterium]|nr:MAG: phosphotransferase family protein [OM182 bacterium]HAL41603.1 phosphotransferase family protein [Gammaproteobacteria bacterium]|tara:strand:+ start:14540 stop:15595 length:1056 start_codon:yes stop_codon:yes gene_type:complete
MSDVELTQVREAHQFDIQALEQYLLAHVEGFAGPMDVRQFEGGQSNPTFQLVTPTRKYVMRKQPPGELLPSAHQVDREYRVMHALWDTDVPVPKMYCLCEDPQIIGTKFYVMEMVEGRLFTENCLPTLSNEERRALYLDLARVLAKLHLVDPQAVGLESFGRPGNYYERQIGRWSKQYVASQTEDIPAMNKLMEWLPNNIPQSVGTMIVHGDYRLGNVLVHPTEPRIVAVLDWELSTLGDGLADLGYICQDYHGDKENEESLAGADLEALGIPAESELLAEYCGQAGLDDIENWPFYLIYNMFRSSGISQGVYKRGLDGNASSATALEFADAARLRSTRGWQMVLDTQPNP